jgi:hypothetical protein
MRLLTKPDLDKLWAVGCSDPECTPHNHTEVYLHAGCIQTAAPGLNTLQAAGWRWRCAECRKPTARIKAGSDARKAQVGRD